MLVISSRRHVQELLGLCLRGSNCRATRTRSNAATIRVVLGGRCSLILLSVVLPKVANVRMTGIIHGRGRVPVVVVATHNRRGGHMRNFLSKTSSCVIGPFDPERIVLHITTVLGQAGPSRSRSDAVRCPVLGVFPSTEGILMSRITVGLAPGRFRLLLCLSGSPRGVFAERILLGRI